MMCGECPKVTGSIGTFFSFEVLKNEFLNIYILARKKGGRGHDCR